MVEPQSGESFTVYGFVSSVINTYGNQYGLAYVSDNYFRAMQKYGYTITAVSYRNASNSSTSVTYTGKEIFESCNMVRTTIQTSSTVGAFLTMGITLG